MNLPSSSGQWSSSGLSPAQSPTALSKLSELPCPLMALSTGLGFLCSLPLTYSFRNAIAVNPRKISLCLQGRRNEIAEWMSLSCPELSVWQAPTEVLHITTNGLYVTQLLTMEAFNMWNILHTKQSHLHTGQRVNKRWIPNLQTWTVPKSSRKRKDDSDRWSDRSPSRWNWKHSMALGDGDAWT